MRLVLADGGVVVHLTRYDEIVGAVGNNQYWRGLLRSVRVIADMFEVGQHVIVVRIPVNPKNIVFGLKIGSVGAGGFGAKSLGAEPDVRVDGYRRVLAIGSKVGAVPVGNTDGFDYLIRSIAMSIQENVRLLRQMAQLQIIVPWPGSG